MNKKITLLSISVALFASPCGADIHTDGTVGRAVHLQGPHFQIGQDLGTLKGNNLFHSFDHFNLSRTESATFTGNSHIQNVISRVTGGDASKIEGTLRSTIGKANFYFINPAGVVFGKNAHVNVPAAFYTSTASELKFADGGRFSAIHPDSNTLSMARPEAFGFLGKQTGTIAVNGSDLVFKSGATVQLSANKISMDNAVISGKEMDLQLAAVGSAKQTVGIKALPNQALQGDIALRNTRLVTEGDGKGRIVMRGRQVNVSGGSMLVTNNGNKNMSAGQGIDIKAGGMAVKGTGIQTRAIGAGNGAAITVNTHEKLVITRDGNISTVTSAKGNAGNIAVNAGSIQIVGLGAKKIVGIIPLLDEIPTPTTGIYSKANSKSNGNTGTVQVTAKNGLVIVKGSGVFSYTASKGNAGSVDVKAEFIRIDGKNSSDYGPDKSIPVTGIFSETAPKATGKTGKVNVNAVNDIIILNGGEIASANLGTGNANGIEVNAKRLRIYNHRTDHTTGISSTALLPSSGNTGGVKINLQEDLILIGGLISSSSFSKGTVGDLYINADTVKIEGEYKSEDSHVYEKWQRGINSVSSELGGKTGRVNIKTKKKLELNKWAIIYASTFSNKHINALNINSESIQLKDNSKIIANGFDYVNNKSADVRIIARRNLMLDDSTINSLSNYYGDVGNLYIKSPSISINNNSTVGAGFPLAIEIEDKAYLYPNKVGKITIIATKSLYLNDSNINNYSDYDSKTPEKSKPNFIFINSPYIVLINGSSIAGDSRGEIPASSIKINTHQLKLDSDSKITTKANQANAGEIDIKAKDWISLHNSQITTSVEENKKGNGGNINIKTDALVMNNGFIQANTKGENASGGTININTKRLVASGGNLQIGGNKISEFQADSGNNVIQAVAPNGVKGNISNNAPQLNIAGVLVNLKTVQPDLTRAGRDPCSDIVRQSTVKKLGKGGVPVFHKGRDGLAIDSLLESPSNKHPTSHSSTLNAANPDCSPKQTQKPQPLAHKIG